MKIFRNKNNLIREISGLKDLGFIPTMGALHQGHISLINKAKKRSKKILVSIYINAKQFDSNKNFKKYPRNLNRDINFLKKKIDYLYIPNNKDIYSFKVKNSIYLDKFSKQLCGKSKPGHFKAVVDVVNRFLEIIKPKSIYLGNAWFAGMPNTVKWSDKLTFEEITKLPKANPENVYNLLIDLKSEYGIPCFRNSYGVKDISSKGKSKDFALTEVKGVVHLMKEFWKLQGDVSYMINILVKVYL